MPVIRFLYEINIDLTEERYKYLSCTATKINHLLASLNELIQLPIFFPTVNRERDNGLRHNFQFQNTFSFTCITRL